MRRFASVALAAALGVSAACGQGSPGQNVARQEGGWNCDTHDAIANSLGLEGYRLAEHEKSDDGQRIEIWKNIVPPRERKPGRDDHIRVQHSEKEDCVIVEKKSNG